LSSSPALQSQDADPKDPGSLPTFRVYLESDDGKHRRLYGDANTFAQAKDMAERWQEMKSREQER
jgi:hypothetical protein